MIVIEVDRNISAVAAAFGFLQDLFAGLFKAEACTPTAHIVAASAAERKEFIPMLFHKEQDPADNIFLFCLVIPKGIPVDVNVQTASRCLVGTVAHGDCLPKDFFPVHGFRVVLQGHGVTYDLKAILQAAVRLDVDVFLMHIGNAFGDNQAEQEDVISRILFFVEKHWNELVTFSRRSSYNMSRWSARFGFEKTGKQILEKAKSGCNGRYVAVNLNNYHTIEFRLFRGTLKYSTFIATLQMVNHICDAAISLSEEGIDAMSWSEFVSSIEEPELIQYLKERRLYVNEMVTESEEM